MHLLVLSAFRPKMRLRHEGLIQTVSMHLLVLSAFRPLSEARGIDGAAIGLNAPSGAQCFPTRGTTSPKTSRKRCLNAPSGAQCFPTPRGRPQPTHGKSVSMHLLVLSAFRRESGVPSATLTRVSMHLLVLSAFRPYVFVNTTFVDA